MLIKCPECRHDVSDRAKWCPQCGFPISEVVVKNIKLLADEKCPICETSEHVLKNGNEICKVCGFVFKRHVTLETVGDILPELSTEECPICRSGTHILKEGNDVCEECGYIFRRNI